MIASVGLVAYRLPSGTLICVDCDVYPPGGELIREGDLRTAGTCDECGISLKYVYPLSGLGDAA